MLGIYIDTSTILYNVFSIYGKKHKKPFIKFSFQKEKWVVSPVEKWVEMSNGKKTEGKLFIVYPWTHFVLCTCIQKNEWLKLETYIPHDRFLPTSSKAA